jgi:hypothetical protein
MSRSSLQAFSFVLAAAILLAFGATGAHAQVVAGGLRGVITDPGGAVIPGATLTATNLATDATTTTTSTSAGVYLLGNLPIGQYRVGAQSEGFKTYVNEQMSVITGTTSLLNITLEIGTVVETVTVTGTVTPLINTENAEMSTNVEQRVVMDLPIGTGGGTGSGNVASGRRQADQFMFLTPGVTGNQFGTHINGSPRLAQVAIIDGIVYTPASTPGFIAQFSPPFESIEEFKLSTTLFPAEYGRGFGAKHFAFKSGGNEFHGNAFEFFRNDRLDARGFFQSGPKSPVRQNNFGGAIGGPIRRNKLFFFATYDRFVLRGGAATRALATLPVAPFRSGDFTRLFTEQGITVYDPATTRADGAGGFVRDAFDNNMIPSSRQSVIYGRVIPLLPNTDTNTLINNFVSRGEQNPNDDAFMYKLDYYLDDDHRLTFSHWFSWFRTTKVIGGFAIACGTLCGSELEGGHPNKTAGGGFRINYDWTISPTVLNHFGMGYSQTNPRRGRDPRMGNQVIQIPGIPLDTPGYPSFAPAGFEGMGNSQAMPNDPSLTESYIWTDTVSIVTGKHQFKFGGEYWDLNYNNLAASGQGGLSGGYFFTNRLTSQPNAPDFDSQGSSWASFYLGQLQTAERRVVAPHRRPQWEYLAMFVDDKIQITPKFTLSLGLRWELPFPVNAANGRIASLDLSLPNPAAGGLPGAHVFGNDAVQPPLDKNMWGPRFGIAYQLNNKTNIRLGYGIMYAQTHAHAFGALQFGNAFQAGFSALEDIISPDDGITAAFSLDDGWSDFTGTLPNTDPGIEVGATGDFMNQAAATQSNIQAFTFNIQRQLASDIVLDIAYVGQMSHRLPANLEHLNQVPSQFLSLGNTLTAHIDSPEARAAGIQAPWDGFRDVFGAGATVRQALRPFPHFLDVRNDVQPTGNANYHAMQLKIQKRFSRGLSFLTSYTLSKTISDADQVAFAAFATGAADTANRAIAKALTVQDIPHNVAVNFIYELPTPDGMTGAAQKILGGWQIGTIFAYRSGQPLSIGGGPSLPLFGGPNRPNRVVGQDVKSGVDPGSFDPATDNYLNRAAFSQPAPFTFGTGARREPHARGFSFYNTDFNIIKRTYFGETANVEFRFETFNLFNQVVFGNPNTNWNSLTAFGTVGGQANARRIVQLGLKINF